MIKLTNVNKYFNKKKSNQIHVLNNVEVSFPKKGLVVILGKSGSGKTTLLNVVGGLDSINNGKLEFLDNDMSKYKSKKWDSIRNEEVGYIFQNYHLQPNLSVYENVAFVLNMIGITDEEEIQTRVSYILKQVGMYEFRRKKALQLSGGQQQRVAIARALVKNPSIIIADEPTGNLDNKNTTDIMNIISKIAKEKLVIMVTHEKEIADFYGDRTILISDGVIIKDSQNEKTLHHGLDVDNAIYLQDLNKSAAIKENNIDVNYYTDTNESNVKVNLIVKNNTLYIDVDSDYKNIVLAKDSQIEIKDEKYEKKTKETLTETAYDLSVLDNSNVKRRHKRVVSTKRSLKYALSKLLSFGRKGKLMLSSFIFSGIMIAISVGVLFQGLLVKPVLIHDKEAIAVYSKLISTIENPDVGLGKTNLNYDTVVSIDENFSFVPDRTLLLEVNTTLAYETNLSFSATFKRVKGFNGKLLKGKLPDENSNEILITNAYANSLLNKTELNFWSNKVSGNDFGIWNIDQLLLESYKLSDSYGKEIGDVKIVGIVNENTDAIYVSEKVFENYYKSLGKNNEKEYYNSLNNVIVLSNNKSSLLKIDTQDVSISDLYVAAYNEAKEAKQFMAKTLIPVGSIFLAFTFIGFYFVLRSSLISRVSEVSIYRALGVRKKEIMSMFAVEIILLTTVSTLIGYILGTLGVKYVKQSLLGNLNLIDLSLVSFLIGLVLIYLINLLAGLLPVFGLVRKTPAQILAKYDM